MAKYLSIDDEFINNIRSNVQQNTFLKDITIPLQFSNQIDVRRTLELLNTSNDVNLQVKLFSVLSACLMLNNDENFEVIIKYRAVYDRVNNVLAKGIQQKTQHALNFLSTLLYVDAEDDGPTKRRTLALYAKNMTRVSGCLATMLDMFTKCVMYHDTWNALCQCLAAACGGSDLNQSYCSHLIPVCIPRCNQTNIEILLVLQSLLTNHNRNMELFLNSNGLSIFTRELLHYDKCLQLLITVVQCPAASPLLLRQAQILNDLRDFLRLYGPCSQIGQKAKIILNHIDLSSRGSDPQINQTRKEPNIINTIGGCNNGQIREYEGNEELDDTATLMQKVMKEVFKYKQTQLESMKKAAPKTDVNSIIRSTSTILITTGGHVNNREVHITNTSNKTKNLIDLQRPQNIQRSYDAEPSFSFLNNLNNDDLYKNRDHVKPINKSNIFNKQKARTNKIQQYRTQKLIKEDTQNDLPHFYRTSYNEKPTSIDSKDFRPIFSSTPKLDEFSNVIDYSKSSIRRPSFSTQSQTTLHRTRKVVKQKPKKMPQNNDKNVKNMSMSSRFFSAINESCTTLVKTVASIFKKNEPLDFSTDITQTHASREENASCSFSFLNYMQKRDAVFNKLLKKKNKYYTDFSVGTELCETCDTQTLKKKMARNEHLKKTVKKLKMGINLYGCDFKKISRTMWPREAYMTPLVLYNLYRKLLLK